MVNFLCAMKKIAKEMNFMEIHDQVMVVVVVMTNWCFNEPKRRKTIIYWRYLCQNA